MKEEQRKKIESVANARISPNRKSLKNKKDQSLLSTIENLCEVEAYVEAVNNFGVNLFGLEEKYVNIVHNLLVENYDEETAKIIIWWVFESISIDGEILPISIKDKGEEKEFVLKTPSQLVKFLKKYIIK